MLVINKPAGLLSVPGNTIEKQDCLISRVQLDFPEALIVHRLDMATSGLMVLARGKASHRTLSILFQNRAVEKIYHAVVAGKFAEQQGIVELPLITDWPNRPRQMVDHTQGKKSITHYRVEAYDAEQGSSRVELKPYTGRTHQLRVHMQAIGHPILGDRLYAEQDMQLKAERLLLHSTNLYFCHPETNSPLRFHSPIPF